MASNPGMTDAERELLISCVERLVQVSSDAQFIARMTSLLERLSEEATQRASSVAVKGVLAEHGYTHTEWPEAASQAAVTGVPATSPDAISDDPIDAHVRDMLSLRWPSVVPGSQAIDTVDKALDVFKSIPTPPPVHPGQVVHFTMSGSDYKPPRTHDFGFREPAPNTQPAPSLGEADKLLRGAMLVYHTSIDPTEALPDDIRGLIACVRGMLSRRNDEIRRLRYVVGED